MKSVVMVLNDFTRKASLTTWYFTHKQLKIKQVLNALQKYTWDYGDRMHENTIIATNNIK